MSLTIIAEEPVDAPEAGDWFIDHVGSWMLDANEHRHDPGWFHPSDLGNAADDELVACFRGARPERNFSPRQLRVFDMGHNRDLAWKGYLAASGLSRCTSNDERRIVFPHLRLRGECDDIVRHPVTGELSIFEFKTKNTFAFSQLREPDPEHIVQVHPYMAGFAIYQALIVYECKNTQATKRYFIDFDAGVWHAIEARLLRLLDQMETPMP